jgi:diacyltrehalose acyltransferase
VRNSVSDLAKNVRNSLKPHPRPKHEAKPKTESDADRAA